MGKLLLGWELGDDPGRVRRLAKIARHLTEHGHHAYLVARDVGEASLALGDRTIEVVQAPLLRARSVAGDDDNSYATYADQLAAEGFTKTRDLLSATVAWQAIIERVEPDIVICDNSPTLALAAHGALPAVFVGDGVSLPPARLAEFPPIRAGTRPTSAGRRVLAAIREVQKTRRRPAPKNLPALFADGARFVCTLPEFDPYLSARTDPIVGPVEAYPEPAPPPEEPRFVAFLDAGDEDIEIVVTSLVEAGLPGTLHCPGLPAPLAAFLAQRRIDVQGPAPSPHAAASGASVVLHHGHLGITQAVLAAGRPQILLPRSLEQDLNTAVLEKRALGVRLGDKHPASAAGEALRRWIDEPKVVDMAMAWARTIHADGPWRAREAIGVHCLGLLS